MRTFSDLDCNDKRVLIRADLNVPLKDGKITNDKRIKAFLPTLKMALEKGAVVAVMSHLGRPTEGEFDPQFSLAPVAEELSLQLGEKVQLEKEWLSHIPFEPGKVILCENVRFNQGEKANDEELGKIMAAQCDIFVMDAFGTAHRAHASTNSVAQFAPIACAGPLLSSEIDALTKGLKDPDRPMLAIVGGAKVSSKLTVLEKLLTKVDHMILGGGIANTFLAATGVPMGKSLYEPDLLDTATRILQQAEKKDISIPLPLDLICGTKFSEDSPAFIRNRNEVTDSDMILDVGPKTTRIYSSMLSQCKTIVWNGPLGVFEFPQFSKGTEGLSKAIAESEAFSMAGGGDTVAAIDHFGVENNISYISTGGGAFLKVLEGETLPAIDVLTRRSSH